MDHFDLTRLSPVSERDISVIVNLINLGDVFFIKVFYGACDSTCGEPHTTLSRFQKHYFLIQT